MSTEGVPTPILSDSAFESLLMEVNEPYGCPWSHVESLLAHDAALRSRIEELTTALTDIADAEPPRDAKWAGEWEIYQAIAAKCKSIARAALAAGVPTPEPTPEEG